MVQTLCHGVDDAAWNESGARAAHISKIRDTMAPSCSKLSGEAVDGEESLRGRCETFFGTLGEKGEG